MRLTQVALSSAMDTYSASRWPSQARSRTVAQRASWNLSRQVLLPYTWAAQYAWLLIL